MPQVRNDQAVTLLAQDYQLRYESNFSWANAAGIHLMLPGLRGFWPMSPTDEWGHAADLGGFGHYLSRSGNAIFGHRDFAPYIYFDGVGDYAASNDAAYWDIIGNELHVPAAYHGVTFGCWVSLNAIAGAADQYIFAKAVGTVDPDVSYTIKNPAGSSVLRASFDGPPIAGGGAPEAQDTTAISAGTWYHVVAKWSPTTGSAEKSIFLDGVKSTAASALTALRNTAAQLRLGCRDTGGGGGLATEEMAGYVSLAFICCYAVADVTIQNLWQQTRALFNK